MLFFLRFAFFCFLSESNFKGCVLIGSSNFNLLLIFTLFPLTNFCFAQHTDGRQINSVNRMNEHQTVTMSGVDWEAE